MARLHKISTPMARQVSIPAKVAYGTGHSLLSVKNMLFHFFFLYFFSNVLGVSEALVVLATMVALVVDAVTDPVMGQISDNSRSDKWGRRHKFMLVGIFPTAIALTLLFSPPESLGQTGLFIWMLGFLLFVRIGLTVYGVPYYALGADLSTDYNERTNIVSVREFFNQLFSISVFLIGLIIFLPQTPEFEDGMMNKAGYAPFVTAMAIIGVIGALIATFGTRHKVKDIRRYENDSRTKWTKTFAQIQEALKIRPFVWLCGGYCLVLILYGTGSALSFYLGGNFWKFTQIEKFFMALAPFVMLIPAVFLASILSAKLDKRPAVLIFIAVYLVAGLSPYLLYFAGALPPIGSPELLRIVAVFNGLGFTGLTGVLVISNSMLADLADLMENETGKRQEGVLYAAFSFAQKLTFIFGTAIAALALKLINFPKQTDPSQIQQSIIDGLGHTMIIATVIFCLAGLFCFWRYDVTRAKVNAVQTSLHFD